MIESLSQLHRLMQSHGATQLLAKRLSPNDNSKNQIYLGGNFSSLNIIPNQGVYTDSNNTGSKRDRFKASITFFWVDEHGKYLAPHAQLILYPKYPEVRLSGFLSGCAQSPSALMQGRDKDRVLFLGISKAGEVLAYVTGHDSVLKRELDALQGLQSIGVFLDLPMHDACEADSKRRLLDMLKTIHDKQWIDACRLYGDGSRKACRAINAGGYTLEAEMGITPNGFSEPDYLGWEVKSHGVKKLVNPASGQPITLMTPEPTAGFYREHGLMAFMHRFGYPDQKGQADRINFGGPYKCGVIYRRTGLTLQVPGFDAATGKIIDVNGGIALLTDEGEQAAAWGFAEMMTHWNRKHAKAVYVPSLRRDTPVRQYCYGDTIQLGEGTDFYRFLNAVASGKVVYDPGIKVEDMSTEKPLMKRRSQFRIKVSDLGGLYHSFEKMTLGSGL